MRTIHLTPEYIEFYDNLEKRVQEKIEYIKDLLVDEEQYIHSKIAKKLKGTDFYELRISMNNAYRVITFTADHEDLNQCTEIIFLNGFMKKSTKDYNKGIKKAIKILKKWIEEI